MAQAAALCSAGAAVLHVSAAGDHTDAPLMMVGFLAAATLQAAAGAVLALGRPGRRFLSVAAFLMLAAVAIWLVSRTAGLPVPDTHAEPLGFKDGATVLLELVAAGCLLLLLRGRLERATAPAWLGPRALAAATTAVLLPGLVLGSGGHSHDDPSGTLVGGHGHGDAFAGLEHGRGHAGAGHSPAGIHRGVGGRHAARTPRLHAGSHTASSGAHPIGPDAGGAHPVGRSHSDGAPHDAPGAHDRAAGGHRERRGAGRDHAGGHERPGRHRDPHAGHADHRGDPCDSDARPTQVVWESGDRRIVHQPAHGGDAAAVRVCRREAAPASERSDEAAPMPSCPPTARQEKRAALLAEETARIISRYAGRPDLALADGFVMLPRHESKWARWVNYERVEDPAVLEPGRIEGFMAMLTDDGWQPVGGIYMTPDGEPNPPNPTGCLLEWRRHVNTEALAARAEASHARLLAGQAPGGSPVWSARVWTYGGLDPWGRDYDGTEPHGWLGPTRPLPVACADPGCA